MSNIFYTGNSNVHTFGDYGYDKITTTTISNNRQLYRVISVLEDCTISLFDVELKQNRTLDLPAGFILYGKFKELNITSTGGSVIAYLGKPRLPMTEIEINGSESTFTVRGTNVVIDWGDGTVDNIGTTSNDTNYSTAVNYWGESQPSNYSKLNGERVSHTYGSLDNYFIKIYGNLQYVGKSINSDFSPNSTEWIGISQWDNVIFNSLDSIFENCRNLTYVPDTIQSDRNIDMTHTFKECPLTQDLNNWDVSGVTRLIGTFIDYSGANVGFNGQINNWDVSSVTAFIETFGSNSQFNQPLNKWNLINATSIASIFGNATSFNQPINNWNLYNCKTFSFAFSGASAFNQPLDKWSTKNAIDDGGFFEGMEEMFKGASSFNQDISNWCVKNISSKPTNFDTNANAGFTSDKQPNWGESC